MKKWLKKINALLLGAGTSISASACREPKPTAPTQKPTIPVTPEKAPPTNNPVPPEKAPPTTNPVPPEKAPTTIPVTKKNLNDLIIEKRLGIIKMASKNGPIYDELLVGIKNKNPITASTLTADDFIFKSFNDKQCTIVGKGKYDDDTIEVTLHYERDQRVTLNSNITTKQLGTFNMGTSGDLTKKMIKKRIINLNSKLENDDIKITNFDRTHATVIANNNDKYFANDPQEFDFKTINFEKLDTSIMENDDIIRVTICNNNNEIFVLTNKIDKNHYKLYRLKSNTLFEKINISVPPSKEITSITNLIADNNGNIWAIINNTIIYKHEVNTISLRPVTMKGIEHKITKLVIDSKDNIYVGANEGTKGTVYKSDGTNDFIPMQGIEHKITELVIDSKDNIYVGANEGTVYKYKSDGTNDFIPMKKLKYKITALVIDSKDNIYASYTKWEEVTVYKSDGTNDFVEKKLLLNDSKKPIKGKITNLITNKAGNVYCIIENHIFYEYNEQTEEFKYIFKLKDFSELTAITFDQINNIYIAISESKSSGGIHYKIYKYDKKTEKTWEMSAEDTIIKPVVTLTTDQNSNIYAATGNFHIPSNENEAKMFKARYNENE